MLQLAGDVLLQDSDQWEVSAGYVGCMQIVIPFTNFYTEPCSLQLDETLITLVPKASVGARSDTKTAPSHAHSGRSSAGSGAEASPFAAGDPGAAQVRASHPD